ncbi:MAG: hypothetical protein GTN40_02225 [Candidatus Aenigmarchaeota archaeon]|nr:hypothetical protein [Candidatus Aenigmarchaeota archaeon]
MEDLWKKFKQETQEHIEKIIEFLSETSSNEKSQLIEPEKPVIIPNNEISQLPEQTQQIVLEENKKFKEPSRKKVYGKLKDLVKEIMEKENVSRAQAYRRAKKDFLRNLNS